MSRADAINTTVLPDRAFSRSGPCAMSGGCLRCSVAADLYSIPQVTSLSTIDRANAALDSNAAHPELKPLGVAAVLNAKRIADGDRWWELDMVILMTILTGQNI